MITKTQPAVQRTTFVTSREMEFFTRKELAMQIGHDQRCWPLALLKELIDNSLDACESAGIVPEISVDLRSDFFSVQDNGPGLPEGTLRKSLDYTVRVSDKSFYVSPTRGQLGNALKCLWVAPFVVDGQQGTAEVSAHGQRHCIVVTLDQIARKPDLRYQSQPHNIKNGTHVKVYWPNLSSYQWNCEGASFYDNALVLLDAYSLFNPLASFTVHITEETFAFDCLGKHWKKWNPNEPTSPWWYETEQLTDLIRAEIAASRSSGKPKTVRQFIAQFAGLSGVLKQMQVFLAAELPGDNLEDLIEDCDVDREAVTRLLAAMQDNSRPIQPKKLGELGLSLLMKLAAIGKLGKDAADDRAYRRAVFEGVPYKKVSGFVGNLPFVLEAAFVVDAEADETTAGEDCLQVTCGINWAPALPGTIPFPELNLLLSEQRMERHDPVTLVVHLACPLVRSTDRGKTRYDLPHGINEALAKCVRSVTKRWTKSQATQGAGEPTGAQADARGSQQGKPQGCRLAGDGASLLVS
jgi:hypothetical protein